MINTAGKFAFVLTAIAFAMAIGYGIAVGDRAGTLILVALGVATIALGLALSASGAIDRPRWVDPASPINQVPVGRSAATRPSAWPIALAAAVTIGVVGLAVGAATLYVGIILVLVAALGWLFQAWREHTHWTRQADRRFRDRVVSPIALPVGAVALILLIVVSVSRILLAVNEKGAVVIAAVCAFAILAVFAFISSRPHAGRNVLLVLAGIALLAVGGAGAAGAAKGPREFENKGGEGQAKTVIAKNTQYDTNQLSLKANTDAQVLFRNEDPGIYHNISVYTQDNKPVEAGPPIRGVEKKLYTFKLAPGTYTFRCDFHVNMVGTLTVQ